MLSIEKLDNTISQYYDEEMNLSELLAFEARIAVSKGIRDYTNAQCFEFFKISNSIKIVRKRANNLSYNMLKTLKKEDRKKLILKNNAVFFERINKIFRNLFLNINRNDPQ